MLDFAGALHEFDTVYAGSKNMSRSLCTVDGKFIDEINLIGKDKKRLEEYYKWQFIYALMKGRGYPQDYIGAEINLPKGNIGSTPIKIDACVFSDVKWLELYKSYREQGDQNSLNELRKLIVSVIEFKREGRRIEQIYNSQIKAALKEPDTINVLGYYYDEGRLYIFRRNSDGIRRFDSSKNVDKSQRILEQLQLEMTDAYYLVPEFNYMLKLILPAKADTTDKVHATSLDPIYTVNGDRFKTSLNRILRALDLQSMTDDQGYMIIIHLIAAKIFDEKNSGANGIELQFRITNEEAGFLSLSSKEAEAFIQRMSALVEEASDEYRSVLSDDVIDWQNISHVKIAAAVVENLQTFSFAKSRRKDLYSLLFYNFASALKKDANAQFLTPLPIIEFLVEIVNPRGKEKVIDPCCGPSDFLAVALSRENSKIKSENLYGVDNDKKMVLLSHLNLLLSGDGNGVIKHVPDQGSLTNKFNSKGDIVSLLPEPHSNGNWHSKWPDKTKLMEFDVVLTNPPFGKGRNLNLASAHDKYAAAFYALYHQYVKQNPKDGLDLGVVFLENAVRSLKAGGRFGIVLSNSIASNNTWAFVRDWLIRSVRLVALFDLPPNIFAETGVNTTLIVGYKPSQSSVEDLLKNNYEVFAKEIHNVGYERRTSNRNIVFDDVYKLDETSFEVMMDAEGGQVLLEDFSETLKDFRSWCLLQEAELRSLFLNNGVV